MSERQDPPLTFRIEPELDKPFNEALSILGWTRTKLVNESVRIALPVILKRQAEAFARLSDSIPGPTPETVKAGKAAAKAAPSKSPKLS